MLSIFDIVSSVQFLQNSVILEKEVCGTVSILNGTRQLCAVVFIFTHTGNRFGNFKALSLS